MGFYLQSFRFSIKRIFLFSVIGIPLIYQHSYRGRVRFMAKLREKEQIKIMQLADAKTLFKEMQQGDVYRELFTSRDYQLADLEGTYKLIIFGDFQHFQRLMSEMKSKLSSQDINFYCVLDHSDQELLDKLKSNPEQFQKDRQTILVGDKTEKEYFLLNEDLEVLLYDQLNRVPEGYYSKISTFMKGRINKDIENKLLKKLKF